jgi:hypothetical protein
MLQSPKSDEKRRKEGAEKEGVDRSRVRPFAAPLNVSAE